ncbi:MAG: DapH/DapD/GlmU-related protein [Acidimicrobiia bacterium]
MVTPLHSHSTTRRLRSGIALDAIAARVVRSLNVPLQWAWEHAAFVGAIGPDTRRGKAFAHFGHGSLIAFPWVSIYNEQAIAIGDATMIGPYVSLSAGITPGQAMLTPTVVRIGSRCLIGRGSGIVGHWSIDIGDDVWTGHHVYITDQNHGYQDVTMPISKQSMPEKAVRIGDGSWLGHGTIVLPGADIGRHVVVGAGSVVTGVLPDFTVCMGSPARPVRRYDAETATWLDA